MTAPAYAMPLPRGYRPRHVAAQIGPDDGYDTLRHRRTVIADRLFDLGVNEMVLRSGFDWEVESDAEGRPVRMYFVPFPEVLPPEVEAMLAERDEIDAKIRLWKRAGAAP